MKKLLILLLFVGAFVAGQRTSDSWKTKADDYLAKMKSLETFKGFPDTFTIGDKTLRYRNHYTAHTREYFNPEWKISRQRDDNKLQNLISVVQHKVDSMFVDNPRIKAKVGAVKKGFIDKFYTLAITVDDRYLELKDSAIVAIMNYAEAKQLEETLDVKASGNQ